MNTTTPPMASIRNSMLPICSTNEPMNACSVCVRDSKDELANCASIRLDTTAGSLPGSRRTTYQPTQPFR